MTQPRGSTSLHHFGTYSKDVSSAGILTFPAQTAVLVMPVVRDQLGFPGGSDGKEAACSAGDVGSIPGSGRCPGEGNGNTLQYSCLENSRTEESGRLQSMGHKVGHDRATNTFALQGPSGI